MLEQYIHKTTGEEIPVIPVPKLNLGKLPLYIIETYKFYETSLFNQEILIAENLHKDEFSVMMTEKHFDLIKNLMHKKVVLCMDELNAITRKRLIEKRINFIIPGKQLFLPEMLMDLRESFNSSKTNKESEKLLPSAQFLVLYHILHHNAKWQIEGHSFKELANKLGYTAMTITNAIENLKFHELIDITGTKEKLIHFRLDRAELWSELEKRKLWINPVLKRIYVDEKPNKNLLYANESALPEYTDMNPGRQYYFAIEKNEFYNLQKNNTLINANEHEGKYCLEVWKYNPVTLIGEMPNDKAVVDPLSLYLSLKDSRDERIEMALEQIKGKYIW